MLFLNLIESKNTRGEERERGRDGELGGKRERGSVRETGRTKNKTKLFKLVGKGEVALFALKFLPG